MDDGGKIAVKMIPCQASDLAVREQTALVISDAHPNIVRYVALAADSDYQYLALELYQRSLADLLAGPGAHASLKDDAGRPSVTFFQVVDDILQGLAAFHEQGFVHRNIRPEHILLGYSDFAKLASMGLSRRLDSGQAFFLTTTRGGSHGWRTPEQLGKKGERALQGQGVDVFSAGLLIHHLLTGGLHAFGRDHERNVLKGRLKLDSLGHREDAKSLIQSMLSFDPSERPSARCALSHPFLWPFSKKLGLHCDLSDRLEEERPESSLLAAFERCTEMVVGKYSWLARLPPELRDDLDKHRSYNGKSPRALLRVMRNKKAHYGKLSGSLKAEFVPLPEGFFEWFAQRFPALLMTCYAFVHQYLREERPFAMYCTPDALEAPLSTHIVAQHLPQAALLPPHLAPGLIINAESGSEAADKTRRAEKRGGGGNVRRKQAAEAAMPADERSKEAMRRAALQTQTAARDKPTATARQKSVEESSRLFEEAFCGHCAMYLAAPHRLKECGHVFCGTCLDDCLANSTACPTCGLKVVSAPSACTTFPKVMAKSGEKHLSAAQLANHARRTAAWECRAAAVHETWDSLFFQK